MRIERVLNAVREALLWMGAASGDPSALAVAQHGLKPSLAAQMTEILDAISELERNGIRPEVRTIRPAQKWRLEILE
jgi:hypothetical protein